MARARGVDPAIAAPAPAKSAPAVGHGHQRVQAERLVGGEHIEAGGPRAVPDQRAGRDRRGGLGDLIVGHAEQDGVDVPAAISPRPSGPMTAKRGSPAARKRAGERGSDPAPADDGQARTGRGVGREIPFQFPHGRYRSVAR